MGKTFSLPEKWDVRVYVKWQKRKIKEFLKNIKMQILKYKLMLIVMIC